MTNTLHRYGNAESFHDDFVIFATPSKAKNDEGCVPRLKRFLELAVPFGPINAGDTIHGAALQPSRELSPVVHWKRDATPDFRGLIDSIDTPATVAVVFGNRAAAEDFLKALSEADLGLSVNISTSLDGAEQCCHGAGLCRHSVGYSLGFEGRTEQLPGVPVLLLSTMCGHGMVPATFAGKMIDWVKEGRRTPEQAADYMSRFCSCGVYNATRAARILEDARRRSR